MSKTSLTDSRQSRPINILLALASVSTTIAAIATVAWYRAETAPVALKELEPAQREILAQQLLEISPGSHEWAWFEPRISYTLRKNSELAIWNDTFHTNTLGYRTGPVKKPEGVYRVLFVGDSWTYGMGVTEEDSYPRVFERIARAHRPEQNVEAWTLALPGYNSFNYVHALKFFYDRLTPDAVVFTPSSNDNHSATNVLPNGSNSRAGVMRDQFGDPHSVVYQTHTITSFRHDQRWEQALAEIKDVETRLEESGIPSVIFWLARWSEDHAHYWTDKSGLNSPYLVVPVKYTLEKWSNPPPLDHGTPEANKLYGHMVYNLLAHELDWEPLPPPENIEWPAIFTSPPRDRKWEVDYKRYALDQTIEQIPEDFRPGESKRSQLQVPGQLNLRTGMMGRATTVLIRRRSKSSQLMITIARIPDATFLYPMEVRVSIPAASQGNTMLVTIPRDGEETTTIELDIPASIPVGAAIDVIIEAERVGSFPDRLSNRSIVIKAIEQRDSSTNNSAL